MSDKSSQSDAASELKPVSSAITTTAKVFSGLSFVAGAINTAVGVVSLFTGKALLTNRQTAQDHPRTYGVTNMLTGGLSLLVGTVGWKSAKGAEAARTFVEKEEAKQQLVDAASNYAEKSHSR